MIDSLQSVFAACLVLLISGSVSPAAADSAIYFLRHAEVLEDSEGHDPALSEAGKERASYLAEYFTSRNIVKVFSTNYKRTRETAAPLAERSGLSVDLYDPRSLQEFAAQLQSMSGAIVVVGHSNTTPMLAFLVAGRQMEPIDELEFDKIYKVTLRTDGDVSFATEYSRPRFQEHAPKAVSFENRNRLEGAMVYRMLHRGDPIGALTVSYAPTKDELLLRVNMKIEKFDVETDLRTQLTLDGYRNLSTRTTGTTGVGPVDVDLRWNGDRIVGSSEAPRNPFREKGRLEIDRTLPASTLGRETSLYLFHDVKLEQFPISFYRHAAEEDLLRLISAEKGVAETITVPAGTFEAIPISLIGGAPSQRVWISTERPRKVVKIDFLSRAMPWIYELVEVRDEVQEGTFAN